MLSVDKIKQTLPHIPDSVIEMWLIEHGKELPWPPKENEWIGIMAGKNIDFWKTTKWNLCNIPLFEKNLIALNRNGFRDMENGYYFREENNPFLKFKDGKQRCEDFISHILKVGVLPKPVILLIDPFWEGLEKGKYKIVDGNHRFLALEKVRSCHKYICDSNEAEKNKYINYLKKVYKIDQIATLKPEQPAWIVTS